MARPRQLVAPPTFIPLPYGLLSVAETPSAADGKWQNGVTYQARCVTTMGALTWDECLAVTGAGGTPPPPAPKAATTHLVTRAAIPFTAYAEFDCSTVGNDDASRLARDALAQAASYQVERAFWTGAPVSGAPVVFPHLADDTELEDADGALLQTVPVTGGPLDAADALGFLEDQLADCYNGAGVIHVPPRALPTLDAWGLVKAQGGRLRTLAGNWVAVGSGYPGTSPAGDDPAAGTAWIYATGAVFAYAGTARVTELRDSLDRAENTVKMIAERTFVLGWDCCHAGALVTLGVPT